MAVVEHRYPDPESLGHALAERLGRDLGAAVADRGRASLVVSGGTTPLPLFRALAGLELPWNRVTVTLADERWVAPTDPASNERLVRETLLEGRAAAARFVGLKTRDRTPETAVAACEAALAEISRPFDAVVLGMGSDGHTASLFPGAPELAQGLDPASGRRCVAVHPGGELPPRMSLTLPALVDSRSLHLHFTGDAKLEVYRRALEDGPVEEMPIRGVLRGAGRRLELWWSP
ncbi:MAG: 6-phosphogluconolactonase [Acidobacteria bacterium]|nr:6-phosphogluconolactonase [Acidobacteriota bacterium]